MTTEAPTSNPVSPPINHGQFITVKLTHENFLLWQAQILPYLHSQCLIGYVTGVIPCPSSTLPAAERGGTPLPNPAYAKWFEQDHAILSAILASLSPEVLSQCLFLTTSKAVWDKLDGLYATQSRARAMQLRMQLTTLKKNDLSATDYFSRVKGLTDNLAAAGEPLRDDEIIAYVLTGLPEEYDLLVTSVTSTPTFLVLKFDSFNARLCHNLPPLPSSIMLLKGGVVAALEAAMVVTPAVMVVAA
jgi:hypothetical protein